MSGPLTSEAAMSADHRVAVMERAIAHMAKQVALTHNLNEGPAEVIVRFVLAYVGVYSDGLGWGDVEAARAIRSALQEPTTSGRE